MRFLFPLIFVFVLATQAVAQDDPFRHELPDADAKKAWQIRSPKAVPPAPTAEDARRMREVLILQASLSPVPDSKAAMTTALEEWWPR